MSLWVFVWVCVLVLMRVSVDVGVKQSLGCIKLLYLNSPFANYVKNLISCKYVLSTIFSLFRPTS
jgi:hypothetical protein